MSRKPPIAPKGTTSGHAFAPPGPGPVLLEAIGTSLENVSSPRKTHSFSDHGNSSLGPIRPRSPRPAEVYSAALAELNEGDGRGLLKIKVSGASPASSPNRRRASVGASCNAPLNPLSPRTTSILDRTGGLSAAAAAMLQGTTSSRHFPLEQPLDAAAGTLPHTPPRKVTSAPDSQSSQAMHRTAANPWRTAAGQQGAQPPNSQIGADGGCLGHLHPQPPAQLPTMPPSPPRPGLVHSPRPAPWASLDPRPSGGGGVTSNGGAAGAIAAAAPPPPHGSTGGAAGPGPGQVPIPPMPPPAAPMPGHHSTQTVSATGVGVQGQGHATPLVPVPLPPSQAALGLPPAPPSVLTGVGSGRQRRDSASSTDSHSPGVYDSPMAGAFRGPSSLGRTPVNGSPTTPSTPSTPTCSNLRPKPPAPDQPAMTTRHSRLSLLNNDQPGAQGQQPGQGGPGPTSVGGAGGAGQPNMAQRTPSQGQVQGVARQLLPSGDEPTLARTHSQSLAAMMAANNSFGGYGGYGSMPGTPSSNSRPNSGRAGSARAPRPPAALLVDCVRSRDERKLADMLEMLRGPQGGPVQGLNDRYTTTGRTPLHEAVLSNNGSMVRLLLEAGSNPNIGHATQGPPLLHAAAFGEVETAELLLQEGADVHACDEDGCSALHFACRGGHIDMARLLIVKYSADWRAKNNDDEMPFDTNPDMLRLVMAGAMGDGSLGGTLGGRGSLSRNASSVNRVAAVAAAAAAAAAGVASPSSAGRSRLHSASGATPPGERPVSGGAGRPGAAASGALGATGSGGSFTSSAAPFVQHTPHSPAATPIDLGSQGSAHGAGGTAGPTSAGGGGGAFGLARRPTPPPEPNTSAGGAPPPAVTRSRSRRNSGSIGGGSALPGNSPSTRTASGQAPTSPLQSDTEGAGPPASPPTLQLPRGVQRQLSRGAVLGDIINAFHQEDVDMVRKSHPPGEHEASPPDAAAHVSHAANGHHQRPGPSNLGPNASPHPHTSPHPHPHPHQSGIPTAPGTKPKDPHAPPAAAQRQPPAPGAKPAAVPTAPGAKPAPHAPAAASGSSSGGAKDAPQGALLPFNVPETSLIRFGVPVQVHQVQGAAGGAAAHGASREGSLDHHSGPMALPSFSAGLGSALQPAGSHGSTSAGGAAHGAPSGGSFSAAAHAGGAGASAGGAPGAGGASSVGFSAAGFTPVPATGFTPRISGTGDVPGVGGGGLGWKLGPAPRVSSSGDDLVSGAPPLVRDSSPVRDRPGQGEGKDAGGAGAQGGGDAGGVGGSRAKAGASGERQVAVRSSAAMAAQALKRMSNTNVSVDAEKALELRAQALFRQSTELFTGGFAWTKGELLGEGAFGKVYAGLNQQTGELMAVKVMQLINKNSHKEAVEAQLQELQHEMSLYKKLAHKHVVGFIHAEYDVKSAAFYIFLEFVPGGSIASMLGRFGRFSEDLVRNYTRQLLLGLEYLHGCKIVHRDLKGGNVLVSRDGVVKLADFGASKAYRDTTITDCMKSVRGSVFWMAPEVIRGTGYGRRADIWSLGCTVIEMLTGTHPWPHLDNQWTAMFTIAKCEEGPPRPKGISEEAARFLDKCLQFDPDTRPTAAELLQDPFVALRPGMGPGAAHLTNREDQLQHSF